MGRTGRALLLALALMFGLLPGMARASEKNAVMPGAAGLSDGSAVFFGLYRGEPIRWRVLDADQGNASGPNDSLSDGASFVENSEAIFLMSEYLLDDGLPFSSPRSACNRYQGSSAQVWCRQFLSQADHFSPAERAAVLRTDKSDTGEILFGLVWSESRDILQGDALFFLSARELSDRVSQAEGEALQGYFSTGGGPSSWWLRSPGQEDFLPAGYVDPNGVVHTLIPAGRAARPAFNLHRAAVLFTSAVPGHGLSLTGEAVFSNQTYAGNEWKMTLLDGAHTLTSAAAQSPLTPGASIRVHYTGASVGHTLSAVIQMGGPEERGGEILYYMDLVEAVSRPEGEALLPLPGDYHPGAMTIRLFTQTKSGDERPDYASLPVVLTVQPSFVKRAASEILSPSAPPVP